MTNIKEPNTQNNNTDTLKLYVIIPQYDNQHYICCTVAAANKQEAIKEANRQHSDISIPYDESDHIIEVTNVPGYKVTLTPTTA